MVEAWKAMASRPSLRDAACAACAIVVGGLGGVPAAAQDMSWAKDVRDDGWGDGRVTTDGSMIIFRRPAPSGPEGYPRLQLRHEYRDAVKVGPKTYLSLLALDEYDCKGGRFRTIRSGAFTRHNAEGDLRQDPATAPTWSTPAPNTVDAKSLAAACEKK
jgi:hypothetical protein